MIRLLHASSRVLKEFTSDDHIPPYAILSHTWGVGEVTLAMWRSLAREELQSSPGYRKIDLCCQQALKDCFEWVWVDT